LVLEGLLLEDLESDRMGERAPSRSRMSTA
jgi:hypothetical protein